MLHKRAADPAPAPSRGHGHIGNLPAPAAAGRTLHRHVPHNPLVLHPDKTVEDVPKFAGTAVENAHQPAHISQNPQLAQRSFALLVQFFGESLGNQSGNGAQITPDIKGPDALLGISKTAGRSGPG